MDMEQEKAACLLALSNEISECNNCELRKYGGQPFIGVGNINAKLFVVGEAPRSYAERQKQPFIVGATGDAINKWLNYMGLKREDVYLTNAVKCALRDARGKEITNGYGPNGGQLQRCGKWVVKEIELIKPSIILTVGAQALQSLLGKSVGTFQKESYCQKIGNYYYCAMFHPARHANPMSDNDKKALDSVRSILEKE